MVQTAQSSLESLVMSHNLGQPERFNGVILGGLAELNKTIQEQINGLLLLLGRWLKP